MSKQGKQRMKSPLKQQRYQQSYLERFKGTSKLFATGVLQTKKNFSATN